MSVQFYLIAFQEACNDQLAICEARQLPRRLTSAEADAIRGLNDGLCQSLKLVFNDLSKILEQTLPQTIEKTAEETAREILESAIQIRRLEMLGPEEFKTPTADPAPEGSWMSFKSRILTSSETLEVEAEAEEEQTGRLVTDWEIVDSHDYEKGIAMATRRFFAVTIPAVMVEYERRISENKFRNPTADGLPENSPVFA